MKLLDLFCGAGGASVGYARAGFEIVGVDINPQPNYPFEFIQADAIEFAQKWSNKFDVIHASPPCQSYSPYVTSSDSPYVPTRGKLEPRLIEGARKAITHKPYIIENVTGAREYLITPFLLCGVMFNLPISRHRLFESNIPIPTPYHPPCHGVAKRYAQEHDIEYRDMSVTGKGRHAGTSDRWKQFMGIDWHMSQSEIIESLPPVYTEYIGKYSSHIF